MGRREEKKKRERREKEERGRERKEEGWGCEREMRNYLISPLAWGCMDSRCVTG